ncbi:MAG TPA: response regulator [Terriglobales bacterium]|nr:response regulator [Terriglobales bacterium]
MQSALPAKTVLLVEDNPDHEALTLRALRRHAAIRNIVVARDGAEALERLFGPSSAQRSYPDLILLDLGLPKLDGIEVLKRLRAEEATRLIPVVVLTSWDETRDVRSSYSNGANSYIRKPVDYDEFMEAARQLGVYWLTLNESPLSRQP